MQLNNGFRQGGFTLLEVMIAAAIMTVGLLGIAGLHVVSLENTNAAYLRSQAVIISQDIVERMRNNPEQVAAGRFNSIDSSKVTSMPSTACFKQDTGCNGATLAAIDIAQWAQTITAINNDNSRRQLPLALATVKHQNNQRFEVDISWQTKNWTHDADSEVASRRVNEKASYSFQVVIN